MKNKLSLKPIYSAAGKVASGTGAIWRARGHIVTAMGVGTTLLGAAYFAGGREWLNPQVELTAYPWVKVLGPGYQPSFHYQQDHQPGSMPEEGATGMGYIDAEDVLPLAKLDIVENPNRGDHGVTMGVTIDIPESGFNPGYVWKNLDGSEGYEPLGNKWAANDAGRWLDDRQEQYEALQERLNRQSASFSNLWHHVYQGSKEFVLTRVFGQESFLDRAKRTLGIEPAPQPEETAQNQPRAPHV